MKKMMIAWMMAASTSLVGGCATSGWQNAAASGVNIKLLDMQFAQAKDRIEALPLNSDERSVVSVAVAELEVHREFLRESYKQNPETLLLLPLQAQVMLDDMVRSYGHGRAAVVAYYERTPTATPDSLLVQYDAAAGKARDDVQALIDSGRGVSIGQMTELLTLVVRAIAVSQGVPLVKGLDIADRNGYLV